MKIFVIILLVISSASQAIGIVKNNGIGLILNAKIDNGDPSALIYLNVNRSIFRSAIIHGDCGIESRFHVFVRGNVTAGPGYSLTIKRIQIPTWVGGGLTLTGLWSGFLVRPCVAVGTGLHLQVASDVAVGLDGTLVGYTTKSFEQRLGFGIFWIF